MPRWLGATNVIFSPKKAGTAGGNPQLVWDQFGGFWKDAGEAPGRTLSWVPSVGGDAKAGTGPAPTGN